MELTAPLKKKRFGPKKDFLQRLQSNNSNDDDDSVDSPQPLSELGVPRRQHADSFSGMSLPEDLRLSFSEIDDGSLQLDDFDFNCSPSVAESSTPGNQDVNDKILTKMTPVISSTSESTMRTNNSNLASNYSTSVNSVSELNDGFFNEMAKSNSISSSVKGSKLMDVLGMKSELRQDSLNAGRSGLAWMNQASWELPTTSQEPQVSTVGSSGDSLNKKKMKVRRTSKNKHTLNMECQVCGDMAAGFYCGAYICEACKKFYMRAFKQDNLKYVCLRDKQCMITKESRVQCQYCRFQKCVKLNMYCPKQGDGESSKDLPMSDIPCRVCSAPSSGFHFGAITCEGCKGFFRRMAKEREPEKYQCNKKGLCEINMITRNLCKACRYHQCLKAGMSVEGSRIGRQPNSVKHAITMELKHSVKVETKSSNSPPDMNSLMPQVRVKEEPLDYTDLIDNNKSEVDNSNDVLLWDDWANTERRRSETALETAPDPAPQETTRSLPESNNFSDNSNSSSHQQESLPQPAFIYKSAHKQNQLMALHQATSVPLWLPKPTENLSWKNQTSHPETSTIWSSVKNQSSGDAISPPHTLLTHLTTSVQSSSLSSPSLSNLQSPKPITSTSIGGLNKTSDLESLPPQSQLNPFPSHSRQNSFPPHTGLNLFPAMSGQNSFSSQNTQALSTHYPTFTQAVSSPPKPHYTTAPLPVNQSTVTQSATYTSPPVVSPRSKLPLHLPPWQQTMPNQQSMNPLTSAPLPQKPQETKSAVLPGPKIKIQVPMTDLTSQLPEAIKRQNGGVANDFYVEKMKEYIQKVVEAGKVLQLLNYRVFDCDLSPTPSMNVDEVKAHFESKYMDPRAGNQIISKADMSMFSSREATWNYMMTNFHHNTYITIRFAKMVPGFKTLSLNDQEKLIKSSIYPIELLNMSKVFDPETKRYNYFTYTMDEENVMMEQFPMLRVFQEHFLHVGEMVTAFGFDDEEFALLSALLLFPAEIPGLENPKAVEDLQTEISCALQYYEEKHFPNGLTRYGVLLVRVAELVQCLLQHNLAIGLLLNNNPTIKVPQLFHELIIESIKEGQPKVGE